jgi:hypothetical protein
MLQTYLQTCCLKKDLLKGRLKVMLAGRVHDSAYLGLWMGELLKWECEGYYLCDAGLGDSGCLLAAVDVVAFEPLQVGLELSFGLHHDQYHQKLYSCIMFMICQTLSRATLRSAAELRTLAR